MSVLRIKSYHSENAIENGIEYAANSEKTTLEELERDDLYTGGLSDNDLSENVKNAFVYATNTEKTTYEADGRELILVSGFNCKPDTATMQFKDDMDKYYRNGHKEQTKIQHAKRIMRAKLDKAGEPVLDKNGEMIYDPKAPIYHDKDGKCVYQEYDKMTESRTAYMWVLSFPGQKELGYAIDPRLVHKIGMEFCQGFLGDYRCTVSTHVNTGHFHNHIMQCAYSMDGTHKYIDNMKTLQQARDFADDLSIRYGIPIIINPEKDKGRSMSWFEWKLRHDGKSWKEQLETDLRTAMDMADNFEQYKQILTSSGYTLRETENHITYYMPDTDKRCRDTLLSEGFLKEDIIRHFNKEIKKERREEPEHKNVNPVIINQRGPIHVPRYTRSGRRRSDLEMILIVAIEIIKRIMDAFMQPQIVDMKKSFKDNPVYKSPTWKLQQMQETLSLVQNMGIENIEELEEKIAKTGADLSHAKSEVKAGKEAYQYEKAVLEQVEEALDLMKKCSDLGIDISNLYIQKSDDMQIREKKAKLMPITPDQRRKIFIELEKHPEYKVGVKYDLITHREAQDIINFLRGKTTIKPEVLAMGTERMESRLLQKYETIYQNKQKALKEKYGDKPATEKQKQTILNILEEGQMNARIDALLFEIAGNTIDPDKMTYYEALRFINYFMDSPLVYNIADDISRDIAYDIAAKRGLTLYREPTLNDVKLLKELFRGDTTKIPSICDPEKPSESTIKGIKDMARLKNVKITVPVETLTKQDANNLYEYLLYYKKTPEFFTSIDEISTDLRFQDETSNLTAEQKTLVYQLKDVMTELSSLGVQTDNLLETEYDLSTSIKSHEEAVKAEQRLKEEYKTLSRIKYNLNLAQNNYFTHGPGFKDKDKVKTEEVETEKQLSEEEKKNEQERDEKIQQDKDKKSYKDQDTYFNKLLGEDR